VKHLTSQSQISREIRCFNERARRDSKPTTLGLEGRGGKCPPLTAVRKPFGPSVVHGHGGGERPAFRALEGGAGRFLTVRDLVAGGTLAWCSVLLYGVPDAEVEALRARWTPMLTEALS